MIELGKKCREKGTDAVLGCYEIAYGKIEAAEEPSKGDGQGCCIMF